MMLLLCDVVIEQQSLWEAGWGGWTGRQNTGLQRDRCYQFQTDCQRYLF